MVADTTALSVAVYTDMKFGDTMLYPGAAAAQRRYTFDAPDRARPALDRRWVAALEGPHVRDPFDERLRSALADAGIGYAVVHGTGAQRLANAWNALNSIASRERLHDALPRGK